MDYEVNPFQILYVTDSPDPRVFVELFSAFPIKHAQALFRSGNVVVRGVQGAGKSMLLNLLRPQIRLAYFQACAGFPVPKQLSRFVGAGINLTRSGILDIGQLPIGEGLDKDESLFPLFFADFLNYYIVQDVLASIEMMAANPDAFDRIVAPTHLDKFAAQLAEDDCWFGALVGCKSFEELKAAVTKRISLYRAFHQCNIPSLPKDIQSSKTSVGEPIARAEEHLKATGVIDNDTLVFVRVDQVERLLSSDALRPDLGRQYRRMINKLLSLRDSRVSYCIGIRTYAWSDDLTIYETTDKLEHIRDYRFIDLDEMLRRQEDQKTWIFPAFAGDVFARRLRHAGFRNVSPKKLLGQVFRRSPTSQDVAVQAKEYCAGRSPEDILRLGNSWPTDWWQYLTSLYKEDPLEARLAAAWALQRGRAGKRGARLDQRPPEDSKPWESEYWKKDRDRMALRQIEARLAQRMKLYGESTIIALSAGNISVFISICHEIWDAQLRADRRKPPRERRDLLEHGISADVQAVGIQTASAHWHEKISEQPKGHDRKRFVDVLGRMFRTWLLEDIALSYPGHNGFSLTHQDLEENPEIARFLKEAVDFGDLYDSEHTTKEKDRKQRTKWYLMPILSDFFQIREAHTREPYYASIANVLAWLKEADVNLDGVDYSIADSRLTRRPARGRPQSLFD